MKTKENEYRIITKVKNNLLLSAIEQAGYKSVIDFCKAHNLTKEMVYQYISFAAAPVERRTGNWTPTAQAIASALKCTPDKLFTQKQTEMLGIKTSVRTVSEEQIFETLEGLQHTDTPLLALETKEATNLTVAALESLSPRLKQILEMHYGLNGQREHTQAEIAEHFGCSNQAIHLAICKALRQLRHPRHRPALLSALETYNQNNT
jgi:RNA polymerase sigma factor (sigma-70 family)